MKFKTEVVELVEREWDDEPSPVEKAAMKFLERAMVEIDRAAAKSKDMPDGKRLRKVLDKIGGELYEEVEFIGRGEYS